jgi:hypothetical protein
METLYRRIEIKEGNSTEPVQYVGVYALNWQKEWGEPEAAFVEEEPLPPQKQVTVEQIKGILSTYEKEWDNEKKEFKPLNHSQKDKIECASQTIHKLCGETPQHSKLTKCYNCGEMVEMISSGEFCPKCMC